MGFPIELPIWVGRIHPNDLLDHFINCTYSKCTLGLGSSALAEKAVIAKGF